MSEEITPEEYNRIVDRINDPKYDNCGLYEILFNKHNCDDLTCSYCKEITSKKFKAFIEAVPSKIVVANRKDNPSICSWPRDSEGDLLDVGDIVIYDGRRCVIRNFEYYGGEKNWFIFSNDGRKLDPDKITKAGRPRTLEEIKQEIRGSYEKGISGLDYDHDRMMSLFYDIVQAWDREVEMEDDE